MTDFKPASRAVERTFLFSSESVNEGHPDKLADQVSQRERSVKIKLKIKKTYFEN